MKKQILLFAFAALVCACEIPFAINDISEPKFMIECIPVPGDGEFVLNVAYADPAYGEHLSGTYSFKSSDVTLEVNDKPVSSSSIVWEQHGNNFRGSVKAGLKPGDKVTVKVSGKNMPDASGSTVIPEVPKVKEVTIEKVEKENKKTEEEEEDDYETKRILIKLDKPVSKNEYYGLHIKVYQEFYAIKLLEKPPFFKLDTTQYSYSTMAGQVASMADLNNLDLDSFANVRYTYGMLINDGYGEREYSPMTLIKGDMFKGDTYSFVLNGSIEGLFDDLLDNIDISDPSDIEDYGYQEPGGGDSGTIDDTDPYNPDDQEYPEDPEDPENQEELSYPIGAKTWYILNFYRLSDEVYNYSKAQYLLDYNMLSNFGVTPPNFTYSNILGGLGIVGGISYAPIDKIPDPDNKEPEMPSMEDLFKFFMSGR